MERNFLQEHIVTGQNGEGLQAEREQVFLLRERKNNTKTEKKNKTLTLCSKTCRTSLRCIEVRKKFCHPSLRGTISITSISIKPNLEIDDFLL